MPARALNARLAYSAKGTIRIAVASQGISRLDVWVDSRPQTSLDVEDGKTTVQLTVNPKKVVPIELFGYDRGELVAAQRLYLDPEPNLDEDD
jgi:hypothetical protein